jgi:hypothetical protein
VVFGLALPSNAPYRLNQKELEKPKTQLNDFLNPRYIWQNKLPYGALVLFVDKKDNKLKMCINYSVLNKITINNNYLLPHSDALLDRFNGLNILAELISS